MINTKSQAAHQRKVDYDTDAEGMTHLLPGDALLEHDVLANYHQICMRQCRAATLLTERADETRRAQHARMQELKVRTLNGTLKGHGNEYKALTP